MDKGSFNRLLQRTVAVPVVLLVVVAGILLVEILSLTAALRWVDHTDQVIAGARQLMRYMVDMETGVRGYHLTGDTSFLAPYTEAKTELPERLAQLEALTIDNPEQQRQLRETRDLDERWMQWAETQIAAHRGTAPSQQDLQAGQDLMSAIRFRQSEFVATEERLRSERVRRAALLRTVVISSALGLLLVVAVVLFTITRRELFALSSTYERHLRAEADKSRELQESRELLQAILSSSADAVISTDAGGKVAYLNPAAQQLTGWQSQDATGQPLDQVLAIIDERTRDRIEDLTSRITRTPMSNHVALVNRAGEERAVELTMAPILDGRRSLHGSVIVFRDVSERRQTEQTLRANERLALAGRLSATIAHEIRNPLDTVSNLIYLLQREPTTTVGEGYLEMAKDEVARIAQITGQLLTFHRESRAPVEVSLPEVLRSVLVVFAPQVRRARVQVEERFDDVPNVRGFPGELRQVFSNLVGNAVDAMPHGGRLILHVQRASLQGDPARRGVRVTVLDTGTGIEPRARRNLFAPFFTTKGERGTGLGLWVSRGIVEKHEGTIHLRSSTRAGRSGTAFSVFLPLEQKLGLLDVLTKAPEQG